MAEIEYGGIKVGGSKLLLIVPLIGTIIGGLWGGFEVYQRYLAMEEKIDGFVSPDLSGFDKSLAVLSEQMALITKEVELYTNEIDIIKTSAEETANEIIALAGDIRQHQQHLIPFLKAHSWETESVRLRAAVTNLS